MLYDKIIMKAVSGIKQRSERQNDLDKIRNTFVDPGIINELNNENNQVLYGRRGTGKSHALRVLQSVLYNSGNKAIYYIDCRTIGSSAQFTDENLSIKHRSFSLFRDLLSEIHNALLEYAVNSPNKIHAKVFSELDVFASTFSDQKVQIQKAFITHENKPDDLTGNSSGIIIEKSFDIDLPNDKLINKVNISRYSLEVDYIEKALFNTIFNSINNIINLLNSTLYLLIDEWSSIPQSVQPYVAEFIKRSLLPCNKLIVKIAAIEYRSNFITYTNAQATGLELGADISTAPSLDSIYGFEERSEQLKADFSEMLYRHISNELPFDYLRKHYHVFDGPTFLDSIFEEDAFGSLALASEGVVRDLINIFIIAFSKVHRPKTYDKRTKINRLVIYESAKQWFDRDKLRNLDYDLKERYMKIVRIAVTENKSRYFAVPYNHNNIETLNKLVDLRVLHLAQATFICFSGEMEMFNVYNIDFGSYASLLEFDLKSKHRDAQFFDRDSFSKFPNQAESIERFLINLELLK